MELRDVIADRDVRKLAEWMGVPKLTLHRQLTELVALLQRLGYELRHRDGGPPPEVPERRRRVVVHIVTDEQAEAMFKAVYEVLGEMADYRDMGETITYEQETQAIVDAVRETLTGEMPSV